jgi:iron(III) transport system substrate-binding protein
VLRQSPDAFAGRVGTYDVRQSGLGYLFATQDARVSETYWRLTEVLGALDAKLFCCSSDMIDAVVSGELAVAYNVLGSYAANRSDSDAFTIVYPSDFTAIMLRTILIPTTSERPDLAKDFVDFVLDSSYRPDGAPILAVPELEPNVDATVNRIRMGPALLVYLDTFKKRSFLAEWENAILQ